MIAGMISIYSRLDKQGTILIGNEAYQFEFDQGQNMVMGDDYDSPVLSGRHEQPDGFQLREPQRGDGVLVELDDENKLLRWGYMRDYELLTKRKYPKSVTFG